MLADQCASALEHVISSARFLFVGADRNVHAAPKARRLSPFSDIEHGAARFEVEYERRQALGVLGAPVEKEPGEDVFVRAAAQLGERWSLRSLWYT